MGNHPCRVAVQVSNPHSTAGETIHGFVYLESSKPVDPTDLQRASIHITLKGEEQTQIVRQIDDPRHHPSKGEKRRQVSDIVRSAAPLVYNSEAIGSLSSRGPIVPGRQYEFPFQIKLPSNLPSSFRFVQLHKHNECDSAQIIYTLSAHVVGLGPQHSAQGTTEFTVKQTPAATDNPQPRRVMSKTFPIKTALIFSQGSLSFGVEVYRTILTPGSVLPFHISGTTDVAVRDFSVRLIETITFQTDKHKLQRTASRTVAEQIVTVPEGSTQLDLPGQVLIPRFDMKESYAGRLLQVQHSLLVVAQTAKGWTTNPKLHCPLWMVRGPPIGRYETPLPTEAASIPIVEVKAEPMPDSWEGETIVLSEAQAIPVGPPTSHASPVVHSDAAGLDTLVPLPPPPSSRNS